MIPGVSLVAERGLVSVTDREDIPKAGKCPALQPFVAPHRCAEGTG